MASEQQNQHYATIGNAFLGKVAERLQNIKPEELSPSDLVAWTKVAAQLTQASQHRRLDPYRRQRILDAQKLDSCGCVTPDVDWNAHGDEYCRKCGNFTREYSMNLPDGTPVTARRGTCKCEAPNVHHTGTGRKYCVVCGLYTHGPDDQLPASEPAEA